MVMFPFPLVILPKTEWLTEYLSKPWEWLVDWVATGILGLEHSRLERLRGHRCRKTAQCEWQNLKRFQHTHRWCLAPTNTNHRWCLAPTNTGHRWCLAPTNTDSLVPGTNHDSEEYSNIWAVRSQGYEIFTSVMLPVSSFTGSSFGITKPVYDGRFR